MAWEPPLGAMQKRVALEKTRTRTGTTWWVTGFPLWGQRGRAAPYCSWVEWSREAGGYGVTQREAGLNERKQSGRQGRGIRYRYGQPRPQLGTERSLLLVLGKG